MTDDDSNNNDNDDLGNNGHKPNPKSKTPPPPTTTPSTPSLSSYFTIPNPLLLQGDLLALLLIALLLIALLLGFTDAITDPAFLPAGGFLQPIPAVPHTLGTLLQRVSAMDVAWVAAALKSRGYYWEAVSDEASTWKCALTIWLDYCSLRVLLAIIVAGVVMGGDVRVDGLDLLRQCWFSLAMVGWRVIYGIHFRQRL